MISRAEKVKVLVRRFALKPIRKVGGMRGTRITLKPIWSASFRAVDFVAYSQTLNSENPWCIWCASPVKIGNSISPICLVLILAVMLYSMCQCSSVAGCCSDC